MAKRFLLVGANDEGICHVQSFVVDFPWTADADMIKKYVHKQDQGAMAGDG